VPFDFSNPQEVSCFSVIHPDRLAHEWFGNPDTTVDLNEVLGAEYVTLLLGVDTELHFPKDETAPVNTVATALAVRCGYSDTDIRGTAHLTGSSGETDTALGMTDEAFMGVYSELAAACTDLGVRLWRKMRPDDLVGIRYTDLATGDLFWFGGAPHRLTQVKDCLPGRESKLSPEAKIMVFDDGEEFWWYPTGTFHDRADHAPAGYWQRTGNQLLPADA
jgi:hypothetical protein